MKKRVTAISIIGLIIMVLVFFQNIVDFLINIKWYEEVGYLSIYFTKITSIIKLMIPLFIIMFISIWLYYRSLKASIIKLKTVVAVDKAKMKVERKIFIISNIILSLIISFSFANNYWYKTLQFINSSNFDVSDPIFKKDVSFFIFKLPLVESLYGAFMSLLFFLVIITFVTFFVLKAKDMVYSGSTGKTSTIKELQNGITKFAGRQLAVVSALIMLLIAVGFLLKSWNLVYSPRGVVFGASYTDVKVTLRFYQATAIAALIASIVIFISIITSKVKPIIISIAVIVVIIIGESITAGIIQRFIVESNGIAMEEPYIVNNIEYTRKAFNLENIDENIFELKNDLSKQDIINNKETIDNIKINSFKPALEFYKQFQYIKPYYTFNDLDVDRYNINGEYTQVFIAPREIDQDALQGKGNTWQNRHLFYTHGYGVVMNKVNSVTKAGQPNFVMKDIPPENLTNIPLDNPRIYFGESTNDYVIVNTKIEELDYPKGDSSESTKYAGEAGINMTLANKLLFAINKKSSKFLLSRDITPESKILINRNILDRVNKIAPFLIYDSDPYLVINEGKLYWTIDAYTVSDRYPFSQPVRGINYIRNSVKVTVDAVNGTTKFYLVDKNDPIAVTYSKIFPTLFKNLEDVPVTIKEHFKYPEGIFSIQCNVFGKYHVKDPGVFIKAEDLWDIASNQEKVEGKEDVNEASYMIMKLPGESKEEMVLVEYFNVKNRDNMAAIFAARMDEDNYGKMTLFRFPVKETVYSPMLFKKKINQDTLISKELSLWDKQGSEVMYGETLIIPINNSLLYVEPMYLRAQGQNSIPEMKRIIVSYNDKIILAETMDEALNKLFSYKKPKAEGNIDVTPIEDADKENVTKARELYEKALEAQKNGNWAEYGDYIEQLGKVLEKLSK